MNSSKFSHLTSGYSRRSLHTTWQSPQGWPGNLPVLCTGFLLQEKGDPLVVQLLDTWLFSAQQVILHLYSLKKYPKVRSQPCWNTVFSLHTLFKMVVKSQTANPGHHHCTVWAQLRDFGLSAPPQGFSPHRNANPMYKRQPRLSHAMGAEVQARLSAAWRTMLVSLMVAQKLKTRGLEGWGPCTLPGSQTSRKAAGKLLALLTFEKPQQPDLRELAHWPLLHCNLFAVSLTIQ